MKSNVLPSTQALKRKRYKMEEFGNRKCSFALEGIDNGMVSMMRRLTPQWFSGRQ